MNNLSKAHVSSVAIILNMYNVNSQESEEGKMEVDDVKDEKVGEPLAEAKPQRRSRRGNGA